MAQASNVSLAPGDLRRHARERWRQDRPRDALDLAWAAFDLAPNERATRLLLVNLLQHYPTMLDAHRQEAYLGLLTDQRVAPDAINIAGWELLLRNYRLFENATDASHEALIEDLERNELALTLLRESPVSLVAAERLLTAVRRWLLLSKRWQRYPKLMTALQAQASLNGGAWPFDDVERARLAEERCNSVTAVYFPIRAAEKNLSTLATDDPITFAVATQYEGWPYPAWTRVTVGNATQLPAVIRAIDHESGETLPIEANMLIAGCGTGRQAATIALCYPDATITAIDLSQASLDYARRQCAALGIVNVRFIKLDLHDVAALNQRFHAIHCTGVLHHLPNPERGLKILADVLHPGAAMRIMVYNRHRRLMMNGARAFVISDLLQEPISDDLLRQVRRRFLEQPKNPAAAYVMYSRDFSTLAGTHDLLLHRHEDPFDVQRIANALTHARLRMLSFDMPSPAIAARYGAMFPNDPKHRDFESWARFELIDPDACEHHFSFWCRSYTS